MEYSYKPTTHGRSAMAAYMALGTKPFDITRVAFGSGRVDEDVNLADVHELLEYVTDGAVAERTHKDERLFLTIQYANSEHKDTPTFLLSEFIVYVRDPETGNETDLIYGTLGDYRQPVPAYNPAYPPSVFNFPLELILSDEIQVDISAPAGLVTWDDLQKTATMLAIRRMDLVIPMEGWEANEESRYPFRLDIPVASVTEAMTPMLTILPESEDTAASCNLAHHIQTLNGAVRVSAKTVPTAPIQASLVLMGDSTGMILSGGAASGETGAIPVASHTQLGGVILGPDFDIDPSGRLSVNKGEVVTDEDMADEDAVHQDVVNILHAEDET